MRSLTRLSLEIIGGLAVLVVAAAIAPNKASRDFGAVVALVVIVMPNIMGWFVMSSEAAPSLELRAHRAILAGGAVMALSPTLRTGERDQV